MGRSRKPGDDVVRGERFKARGGTKGWTASHWGAWLRGGETGKVIAREDMQEAAASRPRVDRLLRIDEVKKLTGLGRTTIWELELLGEFPRRRRRSGARGRAVGWRASEVARWIAERKAARES